MDLRLDTAIPGADSMFSQCHHWNAVPPGNQNNAQLWNPSNSGVALRVSRLIVGTDTGGGFNVICSLDRAPELRNPGHSRVFSEGGKASAKAELRGDVTTSRGKYQHYSVYVLHVPGVVEAGEKSTVILPVDITVTEGSGLMVVGRGDHDLSASFDWEEVPTQ
jgi:hypothetical protein